MHCKYYYVVFLAFGLSLALCSTQRPPRDLDQETLIKAIIWVESKGNSKAVGDDGKAVGVLQLWPIYVREANRLVGYEKYTLDDRCDSLKSVKMFMDIQRYRNPTGDIDKAIHLHNKGQAYLNKVKSKYYEIKQSNQRNHRGVTYYYCWPRVFIQEPAGPGPYGQACNACRGEQ